MLNKEQEIEKALLTAQKNEITEPNKLKILKYFLLSRVFGIIFGIKLMERGEEKAQPIRRFLGLYPMLKKS